MTDIDVDQPVRVTPELARAPARLLARGACSDGGVRRPAE
jgi:hypothetical protein